MSRVADVLQDAIYIYVPSIIACIELLDGMWDGMWDGCYSNLFRVFKTIL